MEQREIDRLNDLVSAHRSEIVRMSPIRFSIKQIQEMSDEQIMSIMTREVDLQGTLYPDMLHLLSAELNKREIQRASKPHWTTIPAFIFAVVAAVASVAALLKEPEPAPQVQQPVTAPPSEPQRLQ